MTDQQSEEKTEKEVYDEERRRREREKGKQKERGKAKLKETLKTESPGKTFTPERLKIPIVRLDENAGIKTKETKIDKEIPDIKEEEPKISIPIVELEKPDIDLKEIVLDKVLPEIKVAERKLEVPLIRLDKPREVRSIITSFDAMVPQISPVIRHVPGVPIYRISSKSTVKEIIDSFDSKVDSRILQRIDSRISEDEKKEEIQKKGPEKVGVSAGGGMDGEPFSDEKEGEEIQDIMDLMFSITGGKIDSGKATIIFLNDIDGESHIGILETICKRAYREKKGGRPNSIIMKDKEEFKKEIRWVEAKDKIFTIELNKNEWDELENKEKGEWNRITNRLDQLFAQGCGFIIFNKQVAYAPQRHRINIIKIEPKKELDPDIKRKISSLMWGFVDVDEGGNFDIIFSSAMDKFEKSLENIQYEKAGLYVDATNSHEGEESEEHLQMKWFVVKILSKKKKLKTLMQIKEKIKTEEEFWGEIPDIQLNNSVYEIETLFAEGREGNIPRNKIKDTITKYEKIEKIIDINIILDNLTFLRHLKELAELQKTFKEWSEKKKKTINFYTLDLQNNRLIPLNEVIKKVKELKVEINRH